MKSTPGVSNEFYFGLKKIGGPAVCFVEATLLVTLKIIPSLILSPEPRCEENTPDSDFSV